MKWKMAGEPAEVEFKRGRGAGPAHNPANKRLLMEPTPLRLQFLQKEIDWASELQT